MQFSYPTTQLQPPWGSQSPPQPMQQQPQAPPQQIGQPPVQQGLGLSHLPGQQQPADAQQPAQSQVPGQGTGQPAYTQQPIQGQPGQGQPGQQRPIQQPGFAQQPIQQPGTMTGGISPPTQQPFQQIPQFGAGSTLQLTGAGQFAGQPSPGRPGEMSTQPQSQPTGQSLAAPMASGQAQPPSGAPQPMGPSGPGAAQQPQPSPAQIGQPELGPGAAAQPLGPDEELLATSPLVDIIDSPEALTVYVDLPGCDEEDVQLKAVGTTLLVSAIRPEEERTEEDRPVQRERLRRIERTITLPVPINVEEAEASCEDGVCKIKLPKSEESRQQSIAFQ